MHIPYDTKTLTFNNAMQKPAHESNNIIRLHEINLNIVKPIGSSLINLSRHHHLRHRFSPCSNFQDSRRNGIGLRNDIQSHWQKMFNIYICIAYLSIYISSNFNPCKLHERMASVYSNLTYWLVNHPNIADFTWTEGETFGSTVFFVSVVVSIYLSVTFILRYAMVSLPSLGPRILKPITAVHSLSGGPSPFV